MVYVLVFVHLDSTGRSILSDPVVTVIRSNHQSPTNDNPQPNPQPGGINQYMHMHATPASPVCCVQSSTPMNLPTRQSSVCFFQLPTQ
jgi:hypothetical protein